MRLPLHHHPRPRALVSFLGDGLARAKRRGAQRAREERALHRVRGVGEKRDAVEQRSPRGDLRSHRLDHRLERLLASKDAAVHRPQHGAGFGGGVIVKVRVNVPRVGVLAIVRVDGDDGGSEIWRRAEYFLELAEARAPSQRHGDLPRVWRGRVPRGSLEGAVNVVALPVVVVVVVVAICHDVDGAFRHHVQRRVRVELVVLVPHGHHPAALALELSFRLGGFAPRSKRLTLALGPPVHHALARHRDDAAAMARQRRAIIVRQRVERVVLVQERADAGEDFLALRARALLALLLRGELALALLSRVALRLSLGGRRRRRRRRITHAPSRVSTE